MTATLYERLGSAAGIEKLVNDLVDAHLANPLIKVRFENAADISVTRRRVFEFFCAGTGGSETYTGEDMTASHKGMNISEQEMLSAIDDVMGAMDKNNLGEAEKKDVLAILYSLKDEVMRV